MSRTGEAAHPSAPTVSKLRMRYAKRGRARFSSHRDVARTMEWTLRRAGIPVALSHGFSPHPRLSWIGAAPTGAASEAEYVEIGLTEHLEPDAVAREVDRALPEGLAVVEVVPAGPGSLADRIDASRWELEIPGDPTQARVETAAVGDPDGADRVAAAVRALWASEQVVVDRMTKNGPRPLDVRAALADLRFSATRSDASARSGLQDRARPVVCGTLSAVVRHTTPAARPDDVLAALRIVADLELPSPALSTRRAQGRLDERGELVDPFEADRAVTHRSVSPQRHVAEDRTV